jgi:hypothetical protein
LLRCFGHSLLLAYYRGGPALPNKIFYQNKTPTTNIVLTKISPLNNQNPIQANFLSSFSSPPLSDVQQNIK